MCGIAGTVGLRPPRDGAPLLDALAHRGPDGHGTHRDTVDGVPVWLGHTRLAVLDPRPEGAQPVTSRDGRWVVVHNGEIVNHRRLRRALGGPFRTETDAETLAEALARWGLLGTLAALDGMFAFAALDRRLGQLHLARDPFGIKPLYLAPLPGGRWAFASEVRALARLDGVDLRPSTRALRTYLALRHVPSPDTMWRGVRRLRPGHVVSVAVRDGRPRERGYDEGPAEPFAGTAREATEAVRAALERAVRRHLLADVPLGMLLSGGLDSAAVAALAARAGAAPPSFTVGFGAGHPECEIDAAAASAAALGLSHAPVRTEPDRLWQALVEAADAVEEPLATSSMAALLPLVRRARRDVTVVLTGQGNDEPWGGYRRHQLELLRGCAPGPLTRAATVAASVGGAAGPWVRRWGPAPGGLGPHVASLHDAAERGLRALVHPGLARRMLEAQALFHAGERRALVGDADPGAALERLDGWLRLVGHGPPAARVLAVDVRMGLADDLLLVADKVAMHVGLELRVPLLDRSLMRLVESLPLRLRVRPGRSKITFRRAVAGLVPDAVLRRPKRGFPIPLGTLARGPWREPMEALLLDDASPLRDLLDRRGVRAVWDEHQDRRRDRSRQLMGLVGLALWARRQRGNAP